MEVISGVFSDRGNAAHALKELRSAGFTDRRVAFFTPGTSESELEKTVPVTDSESAGMGAAMGATLGGAFGAAAGATLGLAAASLAIPGVGPVIAVGAIAASVLGIAGAATGAVAGESVEENLGTALPHEDLFIYEEALRRGNSVIVAVAENNGQAEGAREIMNRNHSLEFDQLRDEWWSTLRDEERTHYSGSGRDFEKDETSYRRGFEAALHPTRRGKSYAEAESLLRKDYEDSDLDTAFRQGYERGKRYHITIVELHKV